MDVVQLERECLSEAGSANGHTSKEGRPSRTEAEAAVRTLIRWAGDDPGRGGLRDTPSRVVRAYEEWFAGYGQDPDLLLRRCFDEIAGYDEMVVLRDIRFHSHCEHHLAPILGHVHIGYLPAGRVIGISKLARLVNTFAQRLQIQERITAQIAETIDRVLKPGGVGVVIEATHACMTTRGVQSSSASLRTSHMLGAFRDQPATRQQFLNALSLRAGADEPNPRQPA